MIDYFIHNKSARNSPELTKLRASENGSLKYGCYWLLMEKLAESENENNSLNLDYEVIDFDIRCGVDTIKSVIHDYNLFVIDNDRFYSNKITEVVETYRIKSEKAKDSISKRWNKNDKENTDVIRTYNERITDELQPNYECNTNKSNKSKESNKINKIKKSNESKKSNEGRITTFSKKNKNEKILDLCKIWFADSDFTDSDYTEIEEKFFDMYGYDNTLDLFQKAKEKNFRKLSTLASATTLRDGKPVIKPYENYQKKPDKPEGLSYAERIGLTRF